MYNCILTYLSASVVYSPVIAGQFCKSPSFCFLVILPSIKMAGMSNQPISHRKAAFLASLGASLEYYDFIVYGLMASYLSRLFFAQDTSWISLLKTFSVFATGYLIRPFGGLVFGVIGDTFGRKTIFVSVMLCMAFATFCIGILPTYDQIGIISPCFLIALRLLQGLSFGAELPGAITVVYEYAKEKNKGLYSSFVISSVSLGSVLASVILYILTSCFTEEQVLNGAWRIPFLIGGMLAIVNYFIRRHLRETPEFNQLQTRRSGATIKTTLQTFMHYKWQVLLGVGVSWFLASLVIFNLYLPTYLTKHYGFESKVVYLAMTIGLVWAALILPFCGKIADKIGKNKIIEITCLGFILGGFFLFQLFDGKELGLLIGFVIIHQTLASLFTAGYFPLLSTLFPTEVRYSGVAACYNITYSMMGCLPLVITLLIEATGTSFCAFVFLALSACVSLFCIIRLKMGAGQSRLVIPNPMS